MTTRREFIKILTGTVIAISLPMGLFSNEGIANPDKYEDYEFTIVETKVVSLPEYRDSFGYALTAIAVLNSNRSVACYSAVGIKDIDNYDKDIAIEDMRYYIREYFIDKSNTKI